MDRGSNALYLILTLVEKDGPSYKFGKLQPVARLKEEIMNVLLALFWGYFAFNHL